MEKVLKSLFKTICFGIVLFFLLCGISLFKALIWRTFENGFWYNLFETGFGLIFLIGLVFVIIFIGYFIYLIWRTTE